MRSTCPSRTTFSIATELLELTEAHRRRPSSSSAPRLGPCGASPRRPRAARTPPPPSPTRPSPRAGGRPLRTCGRCPGWKNARFRTHESRGRIQVMVVGIRTSIEQPADRIQRGLAPTDDHVAGRRDARARPARRPGRSGPLRPRRTAQDRLPAHATPCRSRRQRGCERSRPSPDPVTRERKRRVAQVVAHREEADPPRRQEPVTHDLVEVAADLRAAGSFVEVDVRRRRARSGPVRVGSS